MKQLTILVDMDDTIEHLIEAWVDCLNKRYSTCVKCEDIKEWDLSKAFPGLVKEQIYAPLSENDFWKTVKPMEEAIESLKWMVAQGHSVYIVTASDYRTILPKMENVLFKYFPFISWNQVVISSNKHIVKGDILFDDAPHNLKDRRGTKVLVTSYHNRDYDAESNGMIRMDSWSEAKGIIKVLQQKRGGYLWS